MGTDLVINGRMAEAELFDQGPGRRGPLGQAGAKVRPGWGAGSALRTTSCSEASRTRQGGRCEVYPSLALGEDARLQGDGVVGAALVSRETAVHASLFRMRYGSSRETGAPGMARASVRRGFRSGRV